MDYRDLGKYMIALRCFGIRECNSEYKERYLGYVWWRMGRGRYDMGGH